MTLTLEQQAARKGKLTASRVAVLMNGDAAGIMRLYKEMIGESEPEPADSIDDWWYKEMGSVTEQAQLDYYERKQGHSVGKRGHVITHDKFEWAACTLDGWDDVFQCPIECKMVMRWDPMEIIVEKFQPQLQWQMFVTNADSCALSMSRGGAPPVVDYIDRADDYIEEMINRASYFMACVGMREPPVDMPAMAAPVDPTAIVNMQGNNRWADAAQSYIDLYQGAHDFDAVKELIKSLVPENAKQAFGHGIKVVRDRRGSLRIRKEES